MGFDNFGADESSIFDLAQRAESFLMGFMQIGGDYRLEFDELLIFLLIGVLNISRQQDSFLFVPASMARINAVVKLSKESLRRRLLDLQSKGLVERTRQGFSVHDFNVWRRLAVLSGPQLANARNHQGSFLFEADARPTAGIGPGQKLHEAS